MNRNPILEELYAAREKLLADVGGDVHKYLEGVRKREAAFGRLLQPTPHGTMDCTEAIVAEARREFTAGRCQPMTATEIVRAAQK